MSPWTDASIIGPHLGRGKAAGQAPSSSLRVAAEDAAAHEAARLFGWGPDQQHGHDAVDRQVADKLHPAEERERQVDDAPGRDDDHARENADPGWAWIDPRQVSHKRHRRRKRYGHEKHEKHKKKTSSSGGRAFLRFLCFCSFAAHRAPAQSPLRGHAGQHDHLRASRSVWPMNVGKFPLCLRA
jgi:hypothetical protein